MKLFIKLAVGVTILGILLVSFFVLLMELLMLFFMGLILVLVYSLGSALRIFLKRN